MTRKGPGAKISKRLLGRRCDFMDFGQMYKEKLVSAETASNVVKSGDWVDFGWAATTPAAMDTAIALRLKELHEDSRDIQDRESGGAYVVEQLAHGENLTTSVLLFPTLNQTVYSCSMVEPR